MTTGHGPVRPQWTMQYLSGEGDLLLGDTADLPLLAMPLTPRPIVDDVVPESSVGCPAGEPVVVPSYGLPDLSREGPFDVHRDALESGPLRKCWTVCRVANIA